MGYKERMQMKINLDKFKEFAEKHNFEIKKGFGTLIIEAKTNTRWSIYADKKTSKLSINYYEYIGDVVDGEIEIDETMPGDLEEFYNDLVEDRLLERILDGFSDCE